MKTWIHLFIFIALFAKFSSCLDVCTDSCVQGILIFCKIEFNKLMYKTKI